MSLTRQPLGLAVQTLELPAADLRELLVSNWGSDEAILVGHAFDGVLWGRMREGQLQMACDHLPGEGARLRWETVLDLRLFDSRREVRLWRTDRGPTGLIVSEGPGQEFEAWHDRRYPLMGTPPDASTGDFRVLQGQAGQRHAPPTTQGPPALQVRHYYSRDSESGLLRASEHRYLALVPWKAAR